MATDITLANFLNSNIGIALSANDPLYKILDQVKIADVQSVAKSIAKNVGADIASSGSLKDFTRLLLGHVDSDIFKEWGTSLTSAVTGKLADALLTTLLHKVDTNSPSGTLVKIVSQQVLNDATKAINDWIKGGFAGDLDLLTAVTGGDLIGKLTSLITEDLGRDLAGSLIHIDGVQDQIGVFLGVLVASSFLPPGVAQFAGTIAGEFVFDQVLNDILGIELRFGFSGDRAIEFSYLAYNPATNLVEQVNFWEKKGNASIKGAVIQARDSYLASVNDVINKIGGHIDAAKFGEAADIGFSHHDGGDFAANINNQTINNPSLSYLTKVAIDSDLRRMEFMDGDLILIRAFNQWRNSAEVSPDDGLVRLADYMSVATDYRKYVENVASVNEIIATNPFSAFAAGWSATLLKAKELGLDSSYMWAGTDAAELVIAGSAADRISSAAGNDRISAFGGADIINGGTGSDTMMGGLGDDIFYVEDVGDTVIEKNETGYDTVKSSISFALTGQYIEFLDLIGSANIDATGNTQDNKLYGNDGANKLSGLGGNDTLAGGNGLDTLTGGDGNDTFLFIKAPTVNSIDTITDFSNASGNNDTIGLSKSLFAALGSSVTSSELLIVTKGHAATNTSQNLIYNSKDGTLWYDPDGNKAGGVKEVQVATLTDHPTLTTADFLMV